MDFIFFDEADFLFEGKSPHTLSSLLIFIILPYYLILYKILMYSVIQMFSVILMFSLFKKVSHSMVYVPLTRSTVSRKLPLVWSKGMLGTADEPW